jgi:hypothetical protein
LFEPLSRKATQIAMGPWFIRDRNIPFRPGCSYDVLKKQIQAGRIKPNTVMRGPTTHQFWSVARNVPGVSHLLGYCHECNASVQPTDSVCPQCDTKFPVPSSRNKLGLLYPHQVDVDVAQEALDREINKIFGPGKKSSSGKSAGASQKGAGHREHEESAEGDPGTRAPVQGGIDLLDQVLGSPPGGRKSSHAGAARSANTAKSATPSAASSVSLSPPTAPGKPAALDFAPTVDTQDDRPQSGAQDASPTHPVPVGATHSNLWLIWLLVATNVIVVALLGLAVWYLKHAS